MTVVPQFRDEVGWVRIDHLITEERAADLAVRFASYADGLTDPGPADKPHGGTRRLGRLEERFPETRELAEALAPVVEQILPDGVELMEIAFRCPGPGFGGQRLHADDTPKLDDAPSRCATAIVALTAFTGRSGSTRVVPGSHRRPDLQRSSGSLDHHPDETLLIGPAGTAFVFNGHLLHSGTQNRSSAPRPALQITYRSVTSR
jgi:hypothetical protein